MESRLKLAGHPIHPMLIVLPLGLLATVTIIFPKRFLPPDRWDDAAMAQAKGEIERHLEIVEQSIGDAGYLVADQFTIADIAYAPFLQFLPLMEIEAPPRVAGWRTQLLDRPSARATTPAR